MKIKYDSNKCNCNNTINLVRCNFYVTYEFFIFSINIFAYAMFLNNKLCLIDKFLQAFSNEYK